MIDLVTRDIS